MIEIQSFWEDEKEVDDPYDFVDQIECSIEERNYESESLQHKIKIGLFRMRIRGAAAVWYSRQSPGIQDNGKICDQRSVRSLIQQYIRWHQ